MKSNLLTLTIFCLATTLFAQQTWHKRYPLNPITVVFTQLIPGSDGYYLLNQKELIKTDLEGNVVGTTIIDPSLSHFITFLAERENKLTHQPYFVVAQQIGLNNASIRLGEYIPGAGIQQERQLSDHPVSLNTRTPIVLPANDSVFTLMGHDSIWQVLHRENVGFEVLWQLPLGAPTAAAIRNGTGIVAGNHAGGLVAYDNLGNIIWAKTHPFVVFSALSLATDGILACGGVNNTDGGIAKFGTNGNPLWSMQYNDIGILYDIKSTTDGGIIATGQTRTAPKIVLLRCDASGNEIWRREFENGVGANVYNTADGGFILCGRCTSGVQRFCVIKTDESGLTGPAEDIRPALSSLVTDSTNVSFLPSSVLFFDLNNATFLTNMPGNPSVIFATAPWIGGFDQDHTLHLAADQYAMKDFRMGGINTQVNDFTRIWAIERRAVEALQRDFADNGQIDQPVPSDILSWPAKGNPNFKNNRDFTPVTTDPAYFPAAFVDRNNDGMYNVYDGDYPQIRGDRMLWWTFTDDTVHAGSTGNPIGLEVAVSAYTFDCAATPAVENSIWIDFDLLKRSTGALDSTFFGLFTDFDLGCYEDDYLGTAPEADMIYGYNQDAMDLSCVGVPGFNANIPIESVAMVNQSLSRSIFFNNGGVGNPPPNTTDPTAPLEYYHYLNGHLRDGSPQAIGNFAFPDNPADPNGISMCNENLAYADRRMVYSHGPFTLLHGDTFHLQTVFTLHNNIAYPCPDISLSVAPNVQALKQWRNAGVLDAYSQQEPLVVLPAGQTLTLSPNVPDATYLWSNGAQTPEIEVDAPGLYAVTITNAAGCAREQTVQVNATTAVSDKPSTTVEWDLWPNPAREAVRLFCPDCSGERLQLELRNSQGMLVRSMDILPNANLILDGIPSGVYYCSLRVDGLMAGARKLVVME